MSLIYHIASASDWERARDAGEYRMSTRGRTLEQEGYIHCAVASQLAAIANRYYRGMTGLVLLTIDERRVTSQVRYEPVPGSGEPLPHIYGPLNVDAVVAVAPFSAGGSDPV